MTIGMDNVRRGIRVTLKKYNIFLEDKDMDLLFLYYIDLNQLYYIDNKSILSIPQCYKTGKTTLLSTLAIIDTEENVIGSLLSTMLNYEINPQFKYDLLDDLLHTLAVCLQISRITTYMEKDHVLLFKESIKGVKLVDKVNVYKLRYMYEKGELGCMS